MSDDHTRPTIDEADYREYERKMKLFEEGPTTTHFEQLTAAGIPLPEPEAVADADIRTKLWEVLAGLATVRVYIDHTDHLDDRQLYAELWRREVPDLEVPAREDPPYNRDALLPCAHYELPDAAEWLRANWTASAFATNRFGETARALDFVEQLLAAGATSVGVDNVMLLPNHGWTPYADTLIVRMPEDAAQRRALVDLMQQVGRPDEGAGEIATDAELAEVRLWWD